jgi:hypothetical protein
MCLLVRKDQFATEIEAKVRQLSTGRVNLQEMMFFSSEDYAHEQLHDIRGDMGGSAAQCLSTR